MTNPISQEEKQRYMEALAEWLSHPEEYGERPKTIAYKAAYERRVAGYDITIHLLEYEMPNGKEGRGFAGQFPTWSFLRPGKTGISDDDLIIAFMGWLFMFLAKHENAVEQPTEAPPETERFLTQLKQAGFQDIEIANMHRVYGYTNWEFRATKNGVAYKGAGDEEEHRAFPANSDICSVPLIYTFFGLTQDAPAA